MSVLFYSIASAQTRTIYTCPMHPEVQSSNPGNCPKCGMTLVKKTVKAKPQNATVTKPVQKKPSQSATKVVYACPMHPEIQKSGPGKCPKCGMTLEKKTVRTSNSKPPAKKSVAPVVKAEDTARVAREAETQQSINLVYTCRMFIST